MRHMALHDPDSSAHEKALALKIGRQTKYEIIEGEQVEIMADEDDLEDEEDEDDNLEFEEDVLGSVHAKERTS